MKTYSHAHHMNRMFLLGFFLLMNAWACRSGAQQPATKTLSEVDYKAACELMAVDQLTKNVDSKKGTLVKLTGQIVVFEETRGTDQTSTRLIIAVEDVTNTLPGGKLPVYIMYEGSIDQFINDMVTVYGEIYGNDVYKSPQIEEKTLPRVDAMYIEKAP